MKKVILLSIACLIFFGTQQMAFGQWLSSGNVLYPTPLNTKLNIGTTANEPAKLSILEPPNWTGFSIRLDAGANARSNIVWAAQGTNQWNLVNTSSNDLSFDALSGGSGNVLLLNQAGRVGIGTTNLTNKLTVQGNIENAGGSFILGTRDGRNQGVRLGNKALVHAQSTELDGLPNDVLIINFGGDFEGGARVAGPGLQVSGVHCIGTNKHPAMTAADGSAYRLFVNGGGLFKEVKVELGWADDVFEEDYCRTTLAEEAAFIAKNGHLKGFESAEAMDGKINLGDVTLRQQIKIEEMRLDQIDSDQTIREQQAQITELTALVKTLMQRVEQLEK